MLKKILCVFLSLFLVIASVASGNFTQKLSAANGVDTSKEEKSIDDIQVQIDNNNKQIADYQKQLDANKNNKNKEIENLKILNQKIDLQNENMVAIKSQLDELDKMIVDKEFEIAELEIKIAEQEVSIAENTEIFKKRLLAMYVSGNTDISQILLGASSFVDVWNRIQLVDATAKHDNDLIKNLCSELNFLNINKTSQENAKADLKLRRKQSEQKRQEFEDELLKLNEDVLEANDKISKLDSNEQILSWQIEETKADNEDLEAEQEKIQAEIKRKQEEAKKKAAATGKNNYTYKSGALAWPVPASYRISSTFGPRWGRQHGGIDIAAPKGTAIVAAEGGIVIIANVGGYGGGYGTYVVISHNDTLTTLYGHMSACAVSEGQVVSRGETIGYVGSTGNSTGNHLHFEVRISGVRQEPTAYL